MPNTAADSLISIGNPGQITDDYLHVAVAVIWQTTDQQKFLISKRQKGKHLEGHWEFPGGKVLPGEPIQTALARELIEEVGITPVAINPLIQVYHCYDELKVRLDTWLVHQYDGAVASCEGQELAWVSIAEIDDYLLPAADVPIINALKQLKGCSATGETPHPL